MGQVPPSRNLTSRSHLPGPSSPLFCSFSLCLSLCHSVSLVVSLYLSVPSLSPSLIPCLFKIILCSLNWPETHCTE